MASELTSQWSALETAALATGLSWGSGLRLYAVVFIAGVLQHFGMLNLPGGLHALAHPWVIGTSGVLMLGEFLADKFPGVDSVWDAVHTFIRIPAGAVLAAAAFTDIDPSMSIAAGLVGGVFASGAHLAKAGTRALVNTSPEPFSNWTASTTEDVAVPVGLTLSIVAPWVWLVLVVLFMLVVAWLLPKLWRAMKRVATAIQRQ